MTYQYFSRNGEIRPVSQATVPLANVEYSYGFGVYETIRVSRAKPHFLDEHCGRLMRSAQTIGLNHGFTPAFVKTSLMELLAKNQVQACNLKMLLIGGPTPDTATLDILCLNPLFTNRKLYKDGATCTTYAYERAFPAAKTLNMLQSYLAYREAKAAGAYDALLINRTGHITEGTRSNFFGLKGRMLVTPPTADVLPGVTRHYFIKVAGQNGFKVEEQAIKLADISSFEGALLTSTVSKAIPIRSIGSHRWSEIDPALRDLVAAFDKFLAD